MIEKAKLTEFAQKNGWILTDQSDEDDEKLGDRYIRYLTPQGNTVLVLFYDDGSIHRIVA